MTHSQLAYLKNGGSVEGIVAALVASVEYLLRHS
jgi:hypothetical protein